MITVISFYKFVSLPDYEQLRDPLCERCVRLDLKGTIILAHEGINAMLAGTRSSVDELLTELRTDSRFSDIEAKTSVHDSIPFRKMKVRLKREIVALGVPSVNPQVRVGEYVKPSDWNTLLCDPEVTIIDTRNSFEVKQGTFDGSIDPHTKRFRDFPEFVQNNLDPTRQKKIAMFCTGGIRCEKATGYLLEQGFEHVYHLQGGILKYFEEVPREQSRFVGDCFIFDERVTLDHELHANISTDTE